MAKKEKRISLYKKIWCKIRYWQSIYDVSDTELAAYLKSPRGDFFVHIRILDFGRQCSV